jgi:hypothetical protein
LHIKILIKEFFEKQIVFKKIDFFVWDPEQKIMIPDKKLIFFLTIFFSKDSKIKNL